jgi:hypothetical protein
MDHNVAIDLGPFASRQCATIDGDRFFVGHPRPDWQPHSGRGKRPPTWIPSA